MKRTLLAIWSWGLFLFAMAGPCGAQGNPTTDDGNWHVALSPYLWFPGVSGTAGAGPITVSVRASPGDLLSNFRFGLMGITDVSRSRFVAPLDLVWVRLADEKALPPTNLGITSANFKATQFIVTPKIGFRLVNSEKVQIDALTGVRYWYFGETLSFSPSSLGLQAHRSQNWVDPLVGGRITFPLSPKIVVSVGGDVGGWGAGSQLDYQIAGALGYKIDPDWTIQAGWRYLYANYRGQAIFDAHMSGVAFGLTYNLR